MREYVMNRGLSIDKIVTFYYNKPRLGHLPG